jgi:hypothetical protein
MTPFLAPPVFNLLSQKLLPRLRFLRLSLNKLQFYYVKEAEWSAILGLAKAMQF